MQNDALWQKRSAIPLLFAGLFLFLYSLWLLWGQEQPWERFWIGSLTIIFTGALSAALAWSARRQAGAVRQQQAWQFLAAGLTLWVFKDSLQLLERIAFPGSTAGWLHTLLYGAGSLLVWLGLARLPRQLRPVFSKTRLLIDLTITSAAVIIVLWSGVLQPMLTLLSPLTHPTFITIAIDLFTLVLLLNLFLINDAGYISPVFGLFFLALPAFIYSDLGAISLDLSATPYTAGSVLDIGWVLGDLLIMLAVLAQLRQSHIQAQNFARRLLRRVQALLPILSILLLGWFAIINWQLTGRLDALSLWGTVVLALGLLVRQGIVAGETALEQYAPGQQPVRAGVHL